MNPAAVSELTSFPPCHHENASHRNHATTHLAGPHGTACIDVGVARLVQWLWNLGCRTRYSCQDASGRADVSFWTATDLEVAYGALLLLVADAACLRHRAVGSTRSMSAAGEEHTHDEQTLWSFEVWPRVSVLTGYEPSGDEAGSRSF